MIDRGSLFTDDRISDLPIRAECKDFRTIWEHTCDKSPTDFISSSVKWWASMQDDVQRDIPNLEFSPSYVSMETDSFREERLGLPYLTMIGAICVVVGESKCLHTPIWDFYFDNL